VLLCGFFTGLAGAYLSIAQNAGFSRDMTAGGVIVPGVDEVPVQLIQALPYLLTMFLLAGFIGRAVAPKAIGVPYEKEH